MQAVVEQAASRESLISDNLGLVHSCDNRFRGRGVEYDDLFQAGCVGLIKAADGFDPSRGFAFSTYAVPVILGEIRRIFRDGGTVKVGRAMKEKARNACGKERRYRRARAGADHWRARGTFGNGNCGNSAGAHRLHADRIPDGG